MCKSKKIAKFKGMSSLYSPNAKYFTYQILKQYGNIYSKFI